MSITDENSVLILGAGASAIFGMPLGNSLMKLISKQIDHENKALDQIAAKNFDGTYANHLRQAVEQDNDILNVPIHSAIYAKYSDGRRNEEFVLKNKQLDELLSLLSNQTSETIDDFIVENPSYAEITKICIASIFFKTLYADYNGVLLLKPVAKRTFEFRKKTGEIIEERNWVHLLINIVRQGIRSGAVTNSNKVKIITFNYDMVLEKVLDEQFHNTELMKDKDWRNYIEIIHPHGKCGPIENSGSDGARKIISWAEGIFVIQEDEEIIGNEVSTSRNTAKELVLGAHEIYAAGFSFAAPNCRMLGLDRVHLKIKRKSLDSSFDRVIRFCNYNGNEGVSRAVREFAYARPNSSWTEIAVEEQAGSDTDPLNLADWIRMGVLGELPG